MPRDLHAAPRLTHARRHVLDGQLAIVLEIRERKLDEEIGLVVLKGDLDAISASRADERIAGLTAAGVRFLIVDLTQLQELSSAGLRLLLSTGQALRGKGGRMVLHSPVPVVREVLDLSGFSSLVDVAGSREAAIAILEEG